MCPTLVVQISAKMQNVTGSGKRTHLTGERRGKLQFAGSEQCASCCSRKALMKGNRKALLLTTSLLLV